MQMMSMMPWCLSRFTADQITKAVAEEASEAACDSMQNASTLDEAMPLLKGVVNLSSSDCSQPLAPTVRCSCYFPLTEPRCLCLSTAADFLDFSVEIVRIADWR